MARRGNIYNKDKNVIEDKNTIQENTNENNLESNITDDVNIVNVDESKEKESLQVEDVIKPKEEIGNQKDNNKKKNINQIVFLFIFILALIAVTSIKLVLRYNELNVNENKDIQSSIADDSKYALTDYKEMYYINPINIKDELYYKERGSDKYRTDISYISISGLKNKEVQDKINKEIKDLAYKYINEIGSKEDYVVYTSVGIHVSNVFSVRISISIWDNTKEEYRLYEDYGLTYNLVTGEKINFQDLFTSNTPINSLIYDMAYEHLAWDTEINFDADEIEWDKHTNMDNRDTSEYEDIILKNIRDFQAIPKDKVNFYLTPARVYLNIKLGKDEETSFDNIELYKYIDYIAYYKKYIVSDDVLKDTYETMPTTKQLVFANELETNIFYSEHMLDNLYIYLVSIDYPEDDDEYYADYSEDLKILRDQMVEKNVIDVVGKIKDLAKKNEKYGYIVRSYVDTDIFTFEHEFGKEDFVQLQIEVAIDRSAISYYNKWAFKSLAMEVTGPKVDVWGALLGEINDKNIKRLDDTYSMDIYYNKDGKIVAKDWEKLDEYMDDKYKEPVVEQQKNEVDIYSE